MYLTRRAVRAVVAVAGVAALTLADVHALRADVEKQLQRMRGTVGYETSAAGTDFKPVFGKFNLPDDDFAVTQAKSAAIIVMPDSSLIQLGENTSVKVGAFNNAAAGPGSTITINGGALRFDIKRPAGGAADYHFSTPTSQIAVRGTIGLLALANNITTVACIACAADSVVVTTSSQTVTLLTGQFLTVSATGAITTGAIGTVASGFSSAGVSTSATSGTAGAGAAAGASGAAATGTIAGAAAAAGVAAGVTASQSSTKPQPSPTPMQTPAATPTPATTPAPPSGGATSPTPTPTGQSGNATLTGHGRAAPPPGRPGPPALPGGRGR